MWHSKKFGRLRSLEARYLYLYLLTSPHSNPAGCFDLDEAYALADLRIDSAAYQRALAELEIVRLVSVDKAVDNPVDNPGGSTLTVLVENWCAFNVPANAKHAMKILDELNTVSSAPLKAQRFQEFKDLIEGGRLGNDRQSGDALVRLVRKLAASSQLASTTKTLDVDSDSQTETETETSIESQDYRARVHARDAARNGAAAPLATAKAKPEDNPEISRLLDTPHMRRAALANRKKEHE